MKEGLVHFWDYCNVTYNGSVMHQLTQMSHDLVIRLPKILCSFSSVDVEHLEKEKRQEV